MARSVAAPTKWGNPYRPDQRGMVANAIAAWRYAVHLDEHPDLARAARAELRGLDLACWCPLDLPCHADVLLACVRSAGSATGGRIPTDLTGACVAALSNPLRRDLLEVIRTSGQPVTRRTLSLSADAGESEISDALRVLRSAGLIHPAPSQTWTPAP